MTFFEFLEARRLLSISIYNPTQSISIATTSANDTVLISLSQGNTLSISINGVSDFVLNSFTTILVPEIDISTFGGNDTINLSRTTKPILSDCVISGGAGADTILTGSGNDNISGGNDNDSIDGGLGSDTISGGLGNDTVSYVNRSAAVSVSLDLLQNDGQAGENDWVGAGTSDVESIMGGAGNDTLTGNAFGNYISGGLGADSIHGGAGSDTIVGGAGMDSLYGDDDADFIFARDGEFDVIDGGPGVDSADVDTNPVEAPLPEAPVAALAVLSGSAVKAKTPFSTKGIVQRPVKRVPVSKAKGVGHGPQAGRLNGEPVPAPPGGFENAIDAATLVSVVQPLDPYTEGQVLVTRDSDGNITIRGTDRDDQFIVATIGDPPTYNILNDGGLVQFDTQSPQIHLGSIAAGGNDSLEIDGLTQFNTGYTPNAQPGSGLIQVSGATLTFGGPGASPISSLLFKDIDTLSVATPNSLDVLTLASGASGAPALLAGTSDGVTLTPIGMDNVNTLNLDTGANDQAAIGSADELVVNSVAGDQLPGLSFVPGASGSDTLQINGPLQLVNDPRDPGANPTLTIVTATPTAQVTFLSPLTELAALNIQDGKAIIAAGGTNVLTTQSLNVNSILDLQDNTLIVDYAQGTPSPLSAIAAKIVSAYQPISPVSHWNGPGVTSGVAANDSSKTLGYAESSALFGAAGGNFMGVDIDSTAVLVTFTLVGDGNLDRTVDFADLVTVAQNYGAIGTDWVHGDFNFDGTTDFADLVALAQGYGQVL